MGADRMTPSFYTPLIVMGVLALLFVVEKLFPLRESKSGLIPRLIVNASLSGVTFLALVFQMNTFFHHSNVRLPIRLERVLNSVLVTPRMHGIHHSQVRGETNSNYGVVFCWWDKLHHTLGLNIPQSGIQIGIAGYSRMEDNRLWHTFTVPFRKQRDYWRRSDGTTPERDASVLQGKQADLAE